jgi:cation:H+ antiporter
MGLVPYIAIFVVSIFVLVKASDWFVDSAEVIGLSWGVSPFIIGVTIIAFGTSLPELAASIVAVFAGSSEIVVGNVVGSNITNILLVLGITALIGREIILDFNVMDVDMPMLVGSAIILFFTLSDLHVSYFDAGLYLVGLVVFLTYSIRGKERESIDLPKAYFRNYMLLVVGGFLVYLGAKYTIFSMQHISGMIGVSTEIIALTGVAFGTSLPEVVVSITAAKKGKTAIAVGNVLGSNIFNTYAVMGVSAFCGPLMIPADMMVFSIPFMLAVTILFAVLCLSHRITLWEGILLILFYAFFLVESFIR